MSEAPEESESAPVESEADETPVVMEAAAATISGPSMSQALPWMEAPAALDGTMVGDVGFDPLGFAKTKDELIQYREAEIKHGRLGKCAYQLLTHTE